MAEKAALSIWPSGKPLHVDFNPSTLSVTYGVTAVRGQANTPGGAGQQKQPYLPTGYSSSLSLDLIFDTTGEDGSDVRKKTLPIAQMMVPLDKSKAPLVQFQWGTFLFVGYIQSMTETLNLFSAQGTPLRASVHLGIAGVETTKAQPPSAAGAGAGTQGGAGISASASLSAGAGASASAGISAGAGAGFSASASVSAGVAVGTTPLTLAQAGDTLQSLAARAGVDWRAVAAANNIQNPRQLQPGTVINLNVGASASGSIG